jgi:lipopolysaccharide transport system ATP-binding protein
MNDAIAVSAGTVPTMRKGRAEDTSAAPRVEELSVSARDLSKRYRIEKAGARAPHAGLLGSFVRLLARRPNAKRPGKDFWALHGVTFDIARGERVGVIGRNGAGKTTLLKILSRIVAPTRGEARIRGRVTSLLEVGTGFNNALTGRENIFVNASMHGLGKRETAERFEEIVEFSGIDRRFIDMRVKHYSSGMRVRLAFSVAAHLDADILLLDEVLAVGDLAFQEKCLERVEGMLQSKRTVIFASHDLNSVTRFCDRAIWLEQGRVIFDGPSKEAVAAYADEVRRAITSRRGIRAAPGAGPPVGPPPRSGGLGPATQDGAGAGWPDIEGAAFLGAGAVIEEPPWAEMVATSVIDGDDRELKAATVDQEIGIEFVYDVLRSGKVILPAASFYTTDGILMFTAVYTDLEQMRRPKEQGRYRSVVWIPPHLLNVGLVKVAVSLTTPVSGKLERHVVIPAALSFEVYEAPLGVHSARGSYRDVKGVVRPLLAWETARLE